MSDDKQDDPPLNLGYAEHPFDDIRNLFVGSLIDVAGAIETDRGILAARFWGEISIYGTIKDDVLVVERVRRVALTGELVEPGADHRIGALSLAGPLDEPQLLPIERGVNATFVMQLHYVALSRDLPPLAKSEDAVLPQVEHVIASLRLTQADKRQELEVVLKTSGPLVPLVGAVQAVSLDPIVIMFLPPMSAPPQPLASNPLSPTCPAPTAPCAPGLATIVRRLPLRFINFSNVRTLPDPANPQTRNVEDICKQLLQRACDVWRNKAALELVVEPIILDGTPDQRHNFFNCGLADETELPFDLLPSKGIGPSLASTTHVEVYLVNGLAGGYGGGITHDPGVSTAYIILALNRLAPTVPNPNFYILAHELGHVIGLDHPGTVPPPPLPNQPQKPNCSGSWESIMKATGVGGVSAGPNPSENTLYNCRIFAGGAGMPVLNPIILPLGPPPVNDCFRPNVVDHFIADFPTHNGSEPAVSPASQDLVSNSNVWNRRTNTPGGINSAGGPQHEEPFCTDPANFMHVKLAYRTNLRDPVNVDLYLALPGVGGTSLTSLNMAGNRLTFDIPPAPVLPPAPGATSTQSLSWKLPVGYPRHCSVYAISWSADEPPPSSVTYTSIAARLAVDNDVVQRNMNIQGCTPIGSPFWSMLPWTQMVNPFDEPAPAALLIDTSAAQGLMQFILEVDEERAMEIEVGGQVTVQLAENLGSGERMVLRFRAVLDSDLPRGTIVRVQLHFFAGDRLVGEYMHALQIAPLAETVAEVLDGLFVSVRDVGAGFRIGEAAKLARRIERIIHHYAADPEKALASLSRSSGQFAELAGALGAVGSSETPMVQRRLYELAGVLLSRPKPSSVGMFLEQIRDLADRIQEPAGRLARRALAPVEPGS